MRTLIVTILLLCSLEANPYPFKKGIALEPVTKPTLVKVTLDNELYAHTKSNYGDIRLHSTKGIENYFIKPFQREYIRTRRVLSPTEYERESATITFKFQEAFDIQNIVLDIEDRNFDTLIDLYIDNKIIIKKQKIFDYSQETGNRNFTLHLPKTKAHVVKIVYHLEKTNFFYKKYQHLQELSKYLSIKSATFSNANRSKTIFQKSTILVEKETLKDKKSSYIFKTDAIPFSKIEIHPIEKNFMRQGKIYASDDSKEWRYIKSFSISSSTIKNIENREISVKLRTPYLKLVVENRDNKPIKIPQITLWTTPNYLYFIANVNEKYTLFFGEKNVTKPQYELESLVDSREASREAKLLKLVPLKVEIPKKEIPFLDRYKKILFTLIVLLSLAVLAYIAFILLKGERRV